MRRGRRPYLRATFKKVDIRLALGLFAATFVALPGAAQAKAPDLAVRSVSAPAHVTPDAPLVVQARLARSGRTAKARLSVYLSTDKTRDKADVALTPTATVNPGARTASAQPQVPATQALGSFYVIACIDGGRLRESNTRNNCSVASRPVAISAVRTTTGDLVAASKLSAPDALYYRALAAFGDSRLPAQYAGDGSDASQAVIRDVVQNWSTLSAQQQAALRPYFVPPPARHAGASAAAAKAGPLTCDTEQVKANDWLSLAMPKGHVRVWWPKTSDARIGPKVRSFVAEIENHMWPRYVALLAREPISDAGQRCYHGPDGKLDIYFSSLQDNLTGRTRALTFAYPPNCTGAPTFIVFETRFGLPQRWEVAHELFHAFQYSYKYQGACSGYSNWDEGAATWAAEWLYPKDNYEHKFLGLVGFPWVSFKDTDYDGWTFAYAMAQLHGIATIKSIEDQTEHQPDALHAIDSVIPGGFKQSWPEFARLAWNQDPVEPTFAQWDNFTYTPRDGDFSPMTTTEVDAGLTGQSEGVVDTPVGVLSREYRHLKFGPDVTAVTIVTPYNTDLHVEALEKFRDGSTKDEDLGKRRFAMICPQSAGQRLDDLVLIASNTSMTTQLPADPKIRVVASNLGCNRYTGSASGVEHVHYASRNTTESWSSNNLVFERTFTGDDSPNIGFKLVSGTVTWSFSGTRDGCTVSGGPVDLPVNTSDRAAYLTLTAWIGADRSVRWFSGLAGQLPQVTITQTCQSGTYSWQMAPHVYFQTEDYGKPNSEIPADGVLTGTWSGEEGSGGSRDVTFNYRLAPDG